MSKGTRQRNHQQAMRNAAWRDARPRKNRLVNGVDGDTRCCKWQKFQGTWVIVGPQDLMEVGMNVRVRSNKGTSIQVIARVFVDESGAKIGFPGR